MTLFLCSSLTSVWCNGYSIQLHYEWNSVLFLHCYWWWCQGGQWAAHHQTWIEWFSCVPMPQFWHHFSLWGWIRWYVMHARVEKVQQWLVLGLNYYKNMVGICRPNYHSISVSSGHKFFIQLSSSVHLVPIIGFLIVFACSLWNIGSILLALLTPPYQRVG